MAITQFDKARKAVVDEQLRDIVEFLKFKKLNKNEVAFVRACLRICFAAGVRFANRRFETKPKAPSFAEACFQQDLAFARRSFGEHVLQDGE